MSPTTAMTEKSSPPSKPRSQPQLSSLRFVNSIRQTAVNQTRDDEPSKTVDILQYPTNENNSSPPAHEFGLCHLVAMIDFTHGDEQEWWPAWEAGLATALAVEHLNEGDGRIVPQVEGINRKCPIKFSIEFADTQCSGGVGLQHVIQTFQRKTVAEGLPCAFIGAVRSAVSIPTSTVTGFQGYPQISAQSTAKSLDDSSKYPLFARTMPSDYKTASAVIAYLRHNMDVKHVSVLHVNDDYGHFYMEGLRAAAVDEDVAIESIALPLPTKMSPESLQAAISQIAETQYAYTFCILFTTQVWDAVMLEAHRQGIAGPDTNHFWFFSSTFKLLGRSFPKDSVLPSLYHGVGGIEASGGLPGNEKNKLFTEELRNIYNEEDMAIVEPLLPTGYDLLQRGDFWRQVGTKGLPAPSFFYDATIAMGLAACKAARETSFPFEGSQHYDALKNAEFDGLTGHVNFDPMTGSREPLGTTFTITNYRLQQQYLGNAITDNLGNTEDGNNSMVSFDSYITHVFRNGSWVELEQFVFNDNSTVSFEDLPPVDVSQNYLMRGLHIGTLVMAAIVILLGMLFGVWTKRNEKCRVVRASQPIFLYLICFGVIILGSAMIPLSVDNNIATMEGCTIACNSITWLSCLGFSIIISSLYTKTNRIHRIVQESTRFHRVTVSPSDVAKPMALHLIGNIIVLTAMTVLAPLEWEIDAIEEDIFGRATEVYGHCVAPNDQIPYLIALGGINLLALLFAGYAAFKTRNFSTEFSESRYIMIVLMGIAMIVFFAIPILLLTNDTPHVLVFVVGSMFFLICMWALLWIFTPKLCFFYTHDPSVVTRLQAKNATKPWASSSSQRTFMNNDLERSGDGLSFENKSCEYGLRIKPSEADLRREILELRHLLREKEVELGFDHTSRSTPKNTGKHFLPSHLVKTSDHSKKEGGGKHMSHLPSPPMPSFSSSENHEGVSNYERETRRNNQPSNYSASSKESPISSIRRDIGGGSESTTSIFDSSPSIAAEQVNGANDTIKQFSQCSESSEESQLASTASSTITH